MFRHIFGVTLLLMLLTWVPTACAEVIPVGEDEAQAWVRWTVPLPKSIAIFAKVAVDADKVAITLTGSPDVVTDQARKELRERMGLPGDSPNPPDPQFTIGLQIGGTEAAPLQSLKNSDQAYSITPESGNTGLRLVATTSRGLYYAAKTLQQLIGARVSGTRVEMPLATVTDWPDIKDRGMWGGDTFAQLRWMADRKMNLDEQVAARSVDPVTKVAHAWPKLGRETLGTEGPLYGIKPSHAIPHMELHASTGVFEAYPNLIAVNGTDGAWCYSQPEAIDVLAAWIADLKQQPYAEDVSVWMSENLSKGGCKCSQCSRYNRDILEAQTIVSAWQRARQMVGDMGLRLLTSEETRDSNALIFQTVPWETKIWYYDSLYTYTTGRTPIVSTEVANLAASGRYAGVVPNISAFVPILEPFSCAHFAQYRMNEFVSKNISGLIGYATPTVRHSQFVIEAAAEWSWNAGGRSTREFAASWAVRQGLSDPEKFAEWADTIGPVEWDIYGSDWPRSETRAYPGPVSQRLINGSLPPLGYINGPYRGPWGEIKTEQQLRADVAASIRALRLAHEMGIPEFIYESLVINGHICALKALYELKQLVVGGVVPEQYKDAANTQFRLYTSSLRQVIDALQKWDECITGNTSSVASAISILQSAVDGMTYTAGLLGCGVGAPLTLSPRVTIPQAKAAADGTYVQLTGEIVTSSVSGYSYVQEPDRTAGIKVISSTPIDNAGPATILGTMCTFNGERALQVLTAFSLGTPQQALPLFVRTRDVGGGRFGMQPPVKEYCGAGPPVGQMSSAVGLNNVGLLVKISGTVTGAGSTYFYVDDGCGCNDGSGFLGVRVISGSFAKPALGARVAVTGVSSTYYERGGIWRALVLPCADCWQAVQQ